MKKLFKITILFGLLLAIKVKADMGPPVFPSLKAEIVNEGAGCYEDNDYKKVIRSFKKGQVILVSNSGMGYEYYDEDKQETCYLKSSDLNFNNSKYELKREDRMESEVNLLVVAEDGVEMHKGPSEFYDKLNVKIPKGTTLKTRYAIGDYWYYVTYNETEGYISSEKNKIVVKYEDYDAEVFTTREITITSIGQYFTESEEEYKQYEKENKTLGTIPANTKLTDLWSTDYTRNYYLTYNGVTGFIPGSSSYETMYAHEVSGKLKPLNKMDVYKDIDFDDNGKLISTKIGSIEPNREYEVSYSTSDPETDLYYITSLKGWVYYQFDEKHSKDNYIYTDEKGEVYDSRERTEKHFLETIEVKNHQIEFKKDTYVYTIKLEKDENKLDFVIKPDTGMIVDIQNNEALENGSRVTVKIDDDETSYSYIFNIVKDVEEKKEDTKKESNSNTILLLCLGGALLMVITTVVIIILVNKSRKKKEKKEVVEENINQSIEENTNENKM